jgi:hypothetical protein
LTTPERRVIPTGTGRPALLSVYLNDHLATATGVLALARRAAGSHRSTAGASDLGNLVGQLAEDRRTLIEIMARLDVPRTRYKEPLALAAERLGRWKPNGSLLRRSPLSSVVELEALTLGVTANRSTWRTLGQLIATRAALDPDELDTLVSRADSQLAVLEQLREVAVREALTV